MQLTVVMAELKIASMNVRGIGNNNKRRETFIWLRTNNNHLFARGTLYGFADAKEIFQLLKILSLFKTI